MQFSKTFFFQSLWKAECKTRTFEINQSKLLDTSATFASGCESPKYKLLNNLQRYIYKAKYQSYSLPLQIKETLFCTIKLARYILYTYLK